MVVALGLPLAATSASADVVTPGAVIIVSPVTEFVGAEGYTGAQTINVLRGGPTGPIVGTVTAAPDAAGAIEVNHLAEPPTCWAGVTPDIRVGDVIQIGADTSTVAGVTITQTAKIVTPGVVTIKGTAPDAIAANNRIPVAQIEAQVVSLTEKFIKGDNGAIKANSAGNLQGTLAYDTLTGNAWTATFTGMNGFNPVDALRDDTKAVAGESSASSANLADNEITIAEGPLAVTGPVVGCEASTFASGPTKPIMTALTDTGVTTDGITANLRPTFTGTVSLPDATSVQLFDGVNLIGEADVVRPATGPGTYTVTPTTALLPGTHTISAGEVAPSSGEPVLMGAAPASITIDTVKPTVATRTPALNAIGVARLANPTVTFLEDVTGVTNTRFSLRKFGTSTVLPAVVTYSNKVATLNPSAMLLPGTRYTARLSTLIRDVAGNSMTEVTWNFTTAPGASVPDSPVIGLASPGAIGGTITATARWTPPSSDGGSVINGYVVIALRMNSAGAVVGTTISPFQVATRRALTMTLPAPVSNYRFEVRARNALGTGPVSARSQLVTAR